MSHKTFIFLQTYNEYFIVVNNMWPKNNKILT